MNRIGRWFALICLLSSLLLPRLTPQTTAAPALTPVLAPLALPPLPNLPKPTQAVPSGYTAEQAEALVAPYETAHTLDTDLFDGTFSGPPRERKAFSSGPYHIVADRDAPDIVDLPFSLPGGAHDSITVDVRVKGSEGVGPDSSTAIIEVKPITGTVWFGAAVFTGPPDTTTTPITTVHMTLHTYHIPADVAIQVRFRCGTFWRLRNGWCEFSNLRFNDDAVGWEREPTDSGNANLPIWVRQSMGVLRDPIGPIAPDDGGFFAWEKLSNDGPLNGITYRGPTVQFPEFAEDDVITGTVRWAEESFSPYARSKIQILAVEGDGTRTVLAETAGGAQAPPMGWVTSAPFTVDAREISGQVAQIAVYGYTWVTPPQRTAIDSFELYRNGERIDLPLTDPSYLIPDDQATGRCLCQEDGGEVGQAQAYHGDPVNTRSGALRLEVTDLVVPTSGPPLRMERVYVSMFADGSQYHTTWLGPGWRYALGPILLFSNDTGGEVGTVIFDHPNGSRLRFLQRTDGSYEALRGIRATLVRGEDGYTLTNRDGEIWRFDVDGRIVEREDAQGRIQRSIYGTNPEKPTFGQRIQVLDVTTGRSLWFTYLTLGSGEERIASVRNDANDTISYTYTAEGELETVTNLRGNITRYAYAAETLGGVRRLTTVWKPGDKATVPSLVTSYTNGRVTQQVEHTDLTTTFAYAVAPNGTQVTTIQRDAPGQPRETTTHHYRRDGSLRLITRNGRFVRYQAYGRDMAPTVIVDGDGQATWMDSNDRGQPSVLTNALGAHATVAYTATTLPATVTTFDGITTHFSYDQWRNPTETVRRGSDGLTMRSTAAYDAQHRLVRETQPDGVTIGYGYDSLGQLITTTVGLGTSQPDTTRYVYDTLGRVTDTIRHDGTPLAVTTRIAYRSDWQIDSVIENVRGTGVFNKDYPDQNVKTTYGYDTLGRRIWTRDVLGRYHNVVRFDAAGRIAWRVENPVDSSGMIALPGATPPVYTPAFPDANVVTHYGYDAMGRTVLVTETGILTGTFNLATRQFSAATTRTTRTEYDQLGRPVTVTLNYHPDVTAALADVNLKLYTYYDGAGNITWSSDTLGRWTHTEYDPIGRPVTTTVNFENGNPLTVHPTNLGWTDGTDTDRISVTRYDVRGQVERTIENYVDGTFTITQPVTDRATLYHYDSLGRVITTTHTYSSTLMSGGVPEVNRTTITRYDPLTHRVQATRSVLGAWTVQTYDARGRVIQTIANCRDENDVPATSDCGDLNLAQPDRNIPSGSTYNLADHLVETTDALDRRTAYAYDPLGRVIASTQNYRPGMPITADTNVQTGTSYDALGQVVATSDALGRTTVTQYDRLGHVTAVIDPANITTEQGSDGTGLQRWSATADGKITVTRVDGMGRVAATIQNYQNGAVDTGEPVDRDLITRTFYDQAGRTIATIDVMGRETDIAYDLHDQITAVTENVIPTVTCASRTTNDCNLRTRYHYDRVGNQLAITDANDYRQRITTYNAANWPVTERDLLGHERRWTYDAGGRVATLFTGETTLAYTYDALGRTTEARTSPTAAVVQTSVYNVLGQLTAHQQSAMTPGGAVVTAYTAQYDALGRLIDSGQTISPNIYQATIGYTYNAAGERIGLSYPNGTQIGYTYTPRGELDLVTQGATTLADYTYDSTGWLTQAQFASGVRQTQTRDAVGRLQGREYRTAKGGLIVGVSYTLNRRGERLTRSEQRGGTTTTETSTYDDVSRLASAVQGTTTRSYQYDKAGNRLRSTVNGQITSRSYTAANQVVGWSYDGAGNLLQDDTNQYTYDGFGRLASVRRLSDNATTTNQYMADGTLMRQETTSAAGSERREYETDWASPLTQVLRQTTVSGLGATSSELYVYGAERLFAVDGLFGGTARTWQLHDGLGSVIATTTNTGALAGTQTYDPWGVRQGAGAPISRFGFTGELTDGQSGLLYLRARWYHPTEGTLLGRDPYAGDTITPYSLHPYQYAYSNPGLLTDPTGRQIGDSGRDTEGWADEDTCIGFRLCILEHDARFPGWSQFFAAHQEVDPARVINIHTEPPSRAWEGYAALIKYINHPDQVPATSFEYSLASWYSQYIMDLNGLPGAQDSEVLGEQYEQALGNAVACGDIHDYLEAAVAYGWALGPLDTDHMGPTGGPYGSIYDELPTMRNPVRPPAAPPGASQRPVTVVGETCSFSGDTRVATPDGGVPISTVQVGEVVLAYDEATGETASFTVTAVLAHDDPVLVDLTIAGETITTTPEHPFFTRERGWVNAGDLVPGDQVVTAEGATGTVETVAVRQTIARMYNLTVAEAHTFFVGDGQWLVHNQCGKVLGEWNNGLDVAQSTSIGEVVKYIRDTQSNRPTTRPSWVTQEHHFGRPRDIVHNNGSLNLPDGPTFVLFDVAGGPTTRPGGRGPRRLALGDDGSMYYTNTHYEGWYIYKHPYK